MAIRGIRGANGANVDQPAEILNATRELLAAILRANPTLQISDVSSAIFTLTDDLCSAYPAEAARQLGWRNVPLLCTREIPVPGGLPRCIRVLLHWNTAALVMTGYVYGFTRTVSYSLFAQPPGRSYLIT